MKEELKQAIDEHDNLFSNCEVSDTDFRNGMIYALSKSDILRHADPEIMKQAGWVREEDRPKVICYCGSIRVAKEVFQKAEYDCLMRGEIALLPCCMFVDIQREYGADSEYKKKADEQHKRKIDMCDEVFILNVGGYIGDSTRSEIEYATLIGKPIKYLETI